MTVKEVINKYKLNGIKNMWLCPNLVNDIKMNTVYTAELSINSRLHPILLDAKVTKHWVESGMICICYDWQAVKELGVDEAYNPKLD